MKLVLAYVLGILILLPVTIFILSFLFFRKLLKKQVNSSFRLAADITTFVLFFSVTISITTLWGATFSIVTISISLLIAMIMTYIDWRTQKEIEVVPLLRRIWRMQFLYLLIVYNIVWIVGIVQSVIFFVT
ncbi:MAG: DUF3397 family protein [Bacilli bacterium]|uniref:DUF3397 family protein n=1 Tax=Ureibacillus sp. FSL K6-3587 TaxID=2954681 RepID=UPI001EC73203|nr:DUF3397 domain-containing protein [Bacilli bacterium]